MIYVDDRAGSKELIAPLKKLLGGKKVRPKRLGSADVAWRDAHGKKWGVEVKHLNDVLQCMNNGRFVTQLSRMQKRYDYYWLLVVDEFKASSTGDLEYKKVYGRTVSKWFKPFGPRARGAQSYTGLIGWMTTMEQLAGCQIWHVSNDAQAAHWLASKYSWSQKKKHKSLDVFDISRPAPKKKGGVKFIGKPNEIARVAFALVDKIGWDKAKALSYHFNSVDEFIRADEKQLQEVKGIGKVLAKRIVDTVKMPINKK